MLPLRGGTQHLPPGASPEHLQAYWGDLCRRMDSDHDLLERLDARLSDLVELSRRRKSIIQPITLAASGSGAEYELKLRGYVHSRLYVVSAINLLHNALGGFNTYALTANAWNVLDFPDGTKLALGTGTTANCLLKLSDYEGT